MSTKPPPKNYTPEPEIPAEIQERYITMIEVLSGLTSVSEAARRLNLSRNHFQTILHNMQVAMLESILPKAPGRPPKSEELSTLEEENRRLQKEVLTLRDRVETIDRLLGVAGELARGQTQATPRSSKKKKSKSTESGDADEPETRAELILEKVE